MGGGAVGEKEDVVRLHVAVGDAQGVDILQAVQHALRGGKGFLNRSGMKTRVREGRFRLCAYLHASLF